MNRLICDAIGAPHLYGINAANHEALSAWIVEGR
jgi:hypothetical protein